MAAPDCRKIHLHLGPGLGFKAYDGFGQFSFKGTKINFHHSFFPLITACLQLSAQNRGGKPYIWRSSSEWNATSHTAVRQNYLEEMESQFGRNQNALLQTVGRTCPGSNLQQSSRRTSNPSGTIKSVYPIGDTDYRFYTLNPSNDLGKGGIYST